MFFRFFFSLYFFFLIDFCVLFVFVLLCVFRRSLLRFFFVLRFTVTFDADFRIFFFAFAFPWYFTSVRFFFLDLGFSLLLVSI